LAARGGGWHPAVLPDDLDQVVASLKKAGIAAGAIKNETGRRTLAIDPKIANQVPLFIFDRKG
jgi:hypothetical protein